MEREIIEIPPIELEWQEWKCWDTLKKKQGNRFIEYSPDDSGVYEVRLGQARTRLTIGRAISLNKRIRKQLFRDKNHSEGKRINELVKGDTSDLFIRWAVTFRPAAVEEELQKRYWKKFGRAPDCAKQCSK
jgi:hypothetical protein